MKIRLKKPAGLGYRELEIKKGSTIEEIYLSNKDDFPNMVTIAKMDNLFVELTYMVDRPCVIELLGLDTHVGNLVYQHSLSLVYLKAIKDVLGDKADAEIANPLNRGLYTEIHKPDGVTEKDVAALKQRMSEIISENHPITKLRQKKQLGPSQILYDYEIDGYNNFFYGKMVPSTGYLTVFDLKVYRRGIILLFPHPSNPESLPDPTNESSIYAAFGETVKWQKLLGINLVKDLNEHINNGNIRDIIQLSEALHQKKIVDIAKNITEQEKRIILIAGPSSSGKTTFARRLCVQLRINGLKPLYLGTDDYFLEREDTPVDEFGEKNFEDLEAIDLELFNKQMNGLLAGEEVDIPTFDFITGHKIFGNRKTRIGKNQPIVIEGIHSLNEKLSEKISEDEKYKIYISPFTQLNVDKHNRISTTDARLLRRITRDYQYRGKSAVATIAQWPAVRKGEEKNIFHYYDHADIFFNSAHIYEVAVLKKFATPILKEVERYRAEYAEARRLLEFLAFFEVLDEDRLIANDSILREFIGGSVFVD